MSQKELEGGQMKQKNLKNKETIKDKKKGGNMKRQTKETINFISLIFGIFLIIMGLGGSAITIPTQQPIIILPIISLIVGAILAIMGGLEKWG